MCQTRSKSELTRQIETNWKEDWRLLAGGKYISRTLPEDGMGYSEVESRCVTSYRVWPIQLCVDSQCSQWGLCLCVVTSYMTS